MKNTIALPTLTRVFFQHVDGTEGSFFMPNGADPKQYCHHTPTRIESAPFDHAQRAADVAAALPGDWTIKPTDPASPASSFYLVRADGLKLFIRFTETWGSNGKGYASYQRPPGARSERLYLYDDNRNEVKDPSIKFALTKTAQQVAADVTRRLLPDAEQVHRLAQVALASSHAYATAAEQANDTAKRHRATLAAYGLDIRPSEGSASVEVRCYLTAEQIDKLAARLA
jgi:hypothetical protein